MRIINHTTHPTDEVEKVVRFAAGFYKNDTLGGDTLLVGVYITSKRLSSSYRSGLLQSTGIIIVRVAHPEISDIYPTTWSPRVSGTCPITIEDWKHWVIIGVARGAMQHHANINKMLKGPGKLTDADFKRYAYRRLLAWKEQIW